MSYSKNKNNLDKEKIIFDKIVEYAENMINIKTTALTFFEGSEEKLNDFIKNVSTKLFKEDREYCIYHDYLILTDVKTTQKKLRFNKILSKRAKDSERPVDKILDTNNIACLNKIIDLDQKLENKKFAEAVLDEKINRERKRLARFTDEELEKLREKNEYLIATEYH